MSLFVMDLEQLKQLRELRTFAEQPENLYEPEKNAVQPGFLEPFRRFIKARGTDGKLHQYKVVYTLTRMWGMTVRHASFSLDHEQQNERVPHEGVIQMFCQELGFRGGPKDWRMALGDGTWEAKGVVVIQQDFP